MILAVCTLVNVHLGVKVMLSEWSSVGDTVESWSSNSTVYFSPAKD